MNEVTISAGEKSPHGKSHKSLRLSETLLEKSVNAALAAIEIYNKPDFRFREESFAILMCNAWELLLKAKVLSDAKEDFGALVATRKGTDAAGNVIDIPKTNRSGNPLTHASTYISKRLAEDKNSGYSPECDLNLSALTEIRDNAVHMVAGDLALAKQVLEVGTASLKNYLSVSGTWFGTDFSRYNFFLMPIGFFHDFSEAAAVSLEPGNAATRRLLVCVAEMASKADDASPHQVTLVLKTKLVKGSSDGAVEIKWTDKAEAPEIRVTEESVLKRYPLDAASLAKALKERYSDFKQDASYFKVKRSVESDKACCIVRHLNPLNPRSGSKKFFSHQCFKVFDRHYKRK